MGFRGARSGALATALCFGAGGQGVFGPTVLGVSRLEVFADLEVGVGPEALEVGGDLDGAVVGGEELEFYRDAAGGEAGGVEEAEELLQADGEDDFGGGVAEADVTAAGD